MSDRNIPAAAADVPTVKSACVCHIHRLYAPGTHYLQTTPQKVIAYGISRGRAGLFLEEVSRPARPRDIPYAITFWGVV